MKKGININKNTILRFVFVFVVLTITIFGISFAWYSFTNENLEVTSTTSSWCSSLRVTATVDSTNYSLGAPRSSYSSGNYNIKFTVTNSENMLVRIDTSLIDIIMDEGLKSEHFRYTLTDGSNELAAGNFSNVILGEGSNLLLSSGLSINANSSKSYYLYLWLDSSAGNDLQNSSFSGNIKIRVNSAFCDNAVNTSLYNKVASLAVMDNASSTYVTASTGIDFTQISSDTNGKGVYKLSSTNNDQYPIYYYRGNVNDNNVLFANFCWKIVRTTDTGGVKLIYNGTPDNGKCTNTTGNSTRIGTSKFNDNYDSLAYVGYMYGDIYTYSSETGTGWYYGNDVSWDGVNYTLVADSTNTYSPSVKSTISGTNLYYYHYTCGSNTSLTCSSVRYVYYVSDTTVYYITLSNGKTVENALSEMLDNNTTDSTIKTNIDDWYNSNMTSYTNSYLEDTIYCNDRSISQKKGWDPNGGSTTAYLYFGAFGRSSNPIVTCPRGVDKFTVSSSIGNGKLTYPVGLLTADEVRLAGGSSSSNSSYYLYTYQVYWLDSPLFFTADKASEYNVNASGNLNSNYLINTYGVRPVVSLKPNIKVTDGDGTANNPYTISN